MSHPLPSCQLHLALSKEAVLCISLKCNLTVTCQCSCSKCHDAVSAGLHLPAPAAPFPSHRAASHHTQALFSALFCSLGIWTWNRNLRVYANVLMMLFAYLEVIYKSLHMELLKNLALIVCRGTWLNTTEMEYSAGFCQHSQRSSAGLASAKASLSMEEDAWVLTQVPVLPKGKTPHDALPFSLFLLPQAEQQLQLVLAVGTALLHSQWMQEEGTCGSEQPRDTVILTSTLILQVFFFLWIDVCKTWRMI